MLDRSISKDILRFFSSYIERELGIIYSDFNEFQLIRRLEEIALLLECPSLDELFQRAQKGIHGDFKKMILDVATNNETSFFRDPKVFEMIEGQILPALAKKSLKQKNINIWCAASSTGQEPISLAILIKEYAKQNGIQFNVKILATDISQRVLERAKKSAYSQLEIQRGLPARHMISYFQRLPCGQWKAKEELAQMIEYRELNLKMAFHFPENFDLVLCRNMLIYQGIESKKNIVERILGFLSDDGSLVLGAGESLLGITSRCEPLTVNGAIYYQKSKSLRQVG